MLVRSRRKMTLKRRQENRVPAFRNGALPAINGVQERTQVSHDTDAQAALNEARHAAALKARSPSDALATEETFADGHTWEDVPWRSVRP
jgi:hypothetical protein